MTALLCRNLPDTLWGESGNPWDDLPLVNPWQGHVAIANGSCWGLHADLPGRLAVFSLTMQRDLFRRHVSAWNDARPHGGAPCSLKEFLGGYGAPNPVVRSLGGGDLSAARRRLYEDDHTFGLCEEFDASLELFAKHVPLQDKRYAVVARPRPPTHAGTRSSCPGPYQTPLTMRGSRGSCGAWTRSDGTGTAWIPCCGPAKRADCTCCPDSYKPRRSTDATRRLSGTWFRNAHSIGRVAPSLCWTLR